MKDFLKLILILHVIKILLAQNSSTTNETSTGSIFSINVTATINSTTPQPNLTSTMTSTLLPISSFTTRNSQNVTSSLTQTNINFTYSFLNFSSSFISSTISLNNVTLPVTSLSNSNTTSSSLALQNFTSSILTFNNTTNVSITSSSLALQNFTSSTLTFNNTTYSNIGTSLNSSPTFQSSSPSSVPVNTLTTTKSNSTISSSSPVQIIGLSIDRITSPFWVQTRCDIDLGNDVNNAPYQSDMEKRLSNAYANGSALAQVSGRRKRATTNGLYTLQLVAAQRVTAGQQPTDLVYYIMTSPNVFVDPSAVIRNMNQLSLQQMSIFLGVPVTIVATYYDAAIQNPPIDQKLWIIGAVFGSLGGIVLIVWFVLFLYSKCIRPWDEPLINKFSNDIEGTQISDIHENQAAYSEKINPLIGLHQNETLHSNENEQKNLTTREQKKLNSHNSKKKEDKKLGRRYSSTSSTGLSSITSNDEIDSQPSMYKVKFESSRLEKTSDLVDESQIKSKHKKHKKEKLKNKRKEKEISNLSKSESIEKVEANQSHFVRETPKKLKKEGLTSVDDKETKDMLDIKPEHFQKNETSISLIEVRPSRTESNQSNDFQLLQPVPFLDSYNSIHIFPNYPKDNIVISDTTLNLIEIKETDLLEKDRNDMNRTRSIKNNMRTFDQLPSKYNKKEKHMTTDELIHSLKNEIKEVKLKKEKG